ncbi:MAG: UTP--glucose-1-phosphate uridylyltransferase [Candidatus Woesebacteria bacterium]|nr:UTP--glucose-1-phosphate uridylyltransferase [Candidatus Woesebacteria bacterium]
MKKIRKAVVPAAGYGTRFLPASKAMPKEMLPIVDKPVIQYVVEELAESGIEQVILVTGWHKRAIEDHFDRHLELEYKLKEAGKIEQLEQLRKISKMVEIVYVRQKEQRGNGDAILTAKNLVGDEPFVVCWGDEIFLADPPKTKQLINAYNKYGSMVLAAIRTDNPADTNRYGFAKGEEVEKGVVKVEQFIEKPGINNFLSNLAIIGGYIFPPEIFNALESIDVPEGEELVYVDGVNKLREEGIDAYAVEIKNGKYYDCGNITEYLKTNVEMALKRSDINGEFKKFIKDIAEKI